MNRTKELVKHSYASELLSTKTRVAKNSNTIQSWISSVE